MAPKSGPTPASTQRVVEAIDVGYGRVKLSVPTADGEGFMDFPSLAIPSDRQVTAVIGARRRDTFDVPVEGGALYEVGREVTIAQTGNEYGRAVTDEFLRSPIYEALMKGALRYMHVAGRRVIDLLVLGLPVNQYHDPGRHAFLQQKYTGTLDLGDGLSVTVNEVLVQAQPMGAYIELGNQLPSINRLVTAMDPKAPPITNLDELTVLEVDPGEHTLDWLLIQKGSITNKASGAASDAGRHRIVRAVHEALQIKLGRPLGAATLVHINDALRLNKPLKLSGVSYDLSEFEPLIQSVVRDPLARLVDGMRSMHEFTDLIAVAGGHPERYRRELQDMFPHIPVYAMENSMYAVVMGMKLIGKAVMDASPAESEELAVA